MSNSNTATTDPFAGQYVATDDWGRIVVPETDGLDACIELAEACDSASVVRVITQDGSPGADVYWSREDGATAPGSRRLTVELPDDEQDLTQEELDAAALAMDDDLRDQVHSELAPCAPAEFLRRYRVLHAEKWSAQFVWR